MTVLLDPRNGDVEDDASSTSQRSLLSLAGSLLAEISLPKLFTAWIMLIGLPGLAVGLLPLLVSLWLGKLSAQLPSLLTGLGPMVFLAALLALAWAGGRATLRLLETSFWSLHALGIQPSYVLGREVLRHVAERRLNPGGDPVRRSRIRACCAILSAMCLSLAAGLLAALAWEHTRWTASITDLADPLRLLLPAIANAVMIVSGYFCVAALLWGAADARMAAPLDLATYAAPASTTRQWRIAHLSDVHAVSGPYGWRIECGRAGPRGNHRLAESLARLAEIHAQKPLDAILITGDLTDAGSSAEWAAFLDLVAPYPQLTNIMIGLPGNHDLNVVDRANPARLELPGSPLKRLRQLRTLSALCVLQGSRARVVDAEASKLGAALDGYLAPHRADIARFADSGARRLSRRLDEVAALAYPMILPPAEEDGLGIAVLDSNAATHFSFTNALGMIPRAQLRAVETVTRKYPRALWLIALHHHLVEYPSPAKALSERIGTALINGSQVVRRLQKLAGRVIVMHGHRHTEWVGTLGGLIIVSAPSPVMGAIDAEDTHFFIHTVGVTARGTIALFQPEKIILPGRDGEDLHSPGRDRP